MQLNERDRSGHVSQAGRLRGRVAAAAALALLVTGCGSGTGSDAAPDAPTNAPVRDRAPSASPTPDTGFIVFWPRFRQAALAGDAAGLKAMSAPAVLAHGDLDDEPVARLTPAQVPPVIARLMAMPDTLDAQGHTQRTLFESKARLTAADLDGRGEQRIGNLVFKPDAAGTWHLSDLYVGSDE